MPITESSAALMGTRLKRVIQSNDLWLVVRALAVKILRQGVLRR